MLVSVRCFSSFNTACLLLVLLLHIYPKNVQATIGLAYTLCETLVCRRSLQFYIGCYLGLQTAFLTQTHFECLKIFEGFFWPGKRMAGKCLKGAQANQNYIDYSVTSFWI